MENKALKLIKIGTVILVSLSALSILYNKIIRENTTQENYRANEKFSIVVSEDKWDESTMPRGKRSPKGVLYNPEK